MVGRGISRFPYKKHPHMPGSPTTPGRSGARVGAPARVAFRVIKHVGLRIEDFSRLNGWPIRSPANASPPSSQMSPHDSGASVVRYTFTARDFHSLLFAGFAGALIMSFPLTIEPQPV